MIAAEAPDPVQLFDAVNATLGPMLASLRLAWVLSIHYSDDATMGALLQNISLQIGDFRVLSHLLDCRPCSMWKAALGLTGIAEDYQCSVIGLFSITPLPHLFSKKDPAYWRFLIAGKVCAALKKQAESVSKW